MHIGTTRLSHPLEPRLIQINTIHLPIHPLFVRHPTAHTLLVRQALVADDIRPDLRDVRLFLILLIEGLDPRAHGAVDFDTALNDGFVHLATLTPIDPGSA
jgi:hypothetical protein